MKKQTNRSPTLDELVQFARRHQQRLYQNHARDLCSLQRIAPEERSVAPFLHRGSCENNLDATVRWLKQHVSDAGILVDHLDMEDCGRAFQTELHNKIPTNYWGDSA